MDACTQAEDETGVVLVEDEIATCDEDFAGGGYGD